MLRWTVGSGLGPRAPSQGVWITSWCCRKCLHLPAAVQTDQDAGGQSTSIGQ